MRTREASDKINLLFKKVFHVEHFLKDSHLIFATLCFQNTMS